jgi:hypothetical protein
MPYAIIRSPANQEATGCRLISSRSNGDPSPVCASGGEQTEASTTATRNHQLDRIEPPRLAALIV